MNLCESPINYKKKYFLKIKTTAIALVTKEFNFVVSNCILFSPI